MQGSKADLELNGIHQLLVYAEDFNLTDGDVITIERNVEILLKSCGDVGLEEEEDPFNIIEAVIETQGVTVKLKEELTTYDKLEAKLSVKDLLHIQMEDNKNTEIKPRDQNLTEHVSSHQDKPLLEVKYKMKEDADNKPPVYIEIIKNNESDLEKVKIPVSESVQIDIKQQIDPQDTAEKTEEFHDALDGENESKSTIYIETNKDPQMTYIKTTNKKEAFPKTERLDDKPKLHIPMMYLQDVDSVQDEEGESNQTEVDETDDEFMLDRLANDKDCTTLNEVKVIKKSCNGENFDEDGMKEHQKLFVCSVCTKSFPAKNQLVRHCLGHVREKPYHCIECNLSFKDVGFYNAHMLIHPSDQPYSCSVCNMTFNRKSYLDMHQNVHAVKDPPICGVCEKSFSCRAYLLAHISSHTNQRLYSCKICKMSFTQKIDLDLHVLSHSGGKRFRCDVCRKEFVTKQILHKHQNIHAHEQLICNYCHASFSLKNDLNIHMVRVCSAGKRR